MLKGVRQRLRALCITAGAFGSVAMGGNDRQYQIVYNPTSSVPAGWYLRTPAVSGRPATLVLVRLSGSSARLAAERHYLPLDVPILKHIAAATGDYVCEQSGFVQINSRLSAISLVHDASGRSLTAWRGCRTLVDDEIFLLNTMNAASFDSRYFGPLSRGSIIGRAIPLFTWRAER
jgi:conjugative transfer signal peptidase TraF